MLKPISTEIGARVPKKHFNSYITIVVPQFYIYDARQQQQWDRCKSAKHVIYFILLNIIKCHLMTFFIWDKLSAHKLTIPNMVTWFLVAFVVQ